MSPFCIFHEPSFHTYVCKIKEVLRCVFFQGEALSANPLGTIQGDLDPKALQSIDRMVRVHSGAQGSVRSNSQRTKSELLTSRLEFIKGSCLLFVLRLLVKILTGKQLK